MTEKKSPKTYASSPCFMHELVLGADGYAAVDPQTALDVARWRKTERERLIAARMALSVEQRLHHSETISLALEAAIGPLQGVTVSLYWPFRGEPDLRGWMAQAQGNGARIALPVVVEKAQPLVFREWAPHCRMERGVWNIPVPADGPEIAPDVTIAPLVGVDSGRFRLGYGGGFYDRTLAALSPRPRIIGVGYPLCRIPTIYPQPHDIPMDTILLGN